MSKLIIVALVAVICACSPTATEPPLFVIIIYDETSSMSPDRLEEGKGFANERILPNLTGGDRIAILTMSESSYLGDATPHYYVLQTSPLYFDKKVDSMNASVLQRVKEYVMSVHIKPAYQGTDVYGSLARAADYFSEDTQSVKILIIISDLEDNVAREDLVRHLQFPGVRAYAMFVSHKFKGFKDDYLAFQAKKKYWEDLLHSCGTLNTFVWDTEISRVNMERVASRVHGDE